MHVCALGLAVAVAALLPAMMVNGAYGEGTPLVHDRINGAGDVWFRDPYSVAVAPDGRIVVADIGYDQSGRAGRIQVFDPDGTPALALGLTDTLGEEIRAPFGVAVAPDGRIVVAANVNYSSSYRIHALHPNGTLDRAFGAYGGSGLDMDYSHGVAVAPDGRIIVAASGRMNVHHPNGTLDDAFWVYETTSRDLWLRDVAVAPDGRIVVIDDNFRHGNSLHVVSLNGTFVPDYGLYNSTLALNHTGFPSGVAVAPDGRIVVAEEWDDRIQVLHPNGTLDHAFGSYGAGPGQFARPYDVAVAPDGKIVVADRYNDRIQVLHPNGTLAMALGSEVVVDGGFYDHPGIAVAPDGRIVVADTGNDRILTFHPNGTLDHAFGSYGAGPGQFDDPHDVAVAPDGRIVVWDNGPLVSIQVFHPNGTPALALGSEDTVDGGFSHPSDSAVAPDGRIVVSTTVYSNNYSNIDDRILTFHPNGTLDEAFWLVDEGNETLSLRDFAVAPDGRIVAAVDVYNSSTRQHQTGYRILTLHPNGTLDHAFDSYDRPPNYRGGGGFGSPGLHEIAVAPDGRIVVWDYYAPWDFNNDRILTFHPNGTLDEAFWLVDEGNETLSLRDFAVAPDGRIVVYAGVDIMTFHPNGTLDTNFEVYGAYNELITDSYSFAVAPDGRIVVAGYSEADYRHHIYVFHPNGTLALVLAGNGPDRFVGLSDLAVAPDGRIVVADASYGRIHIFNSDGTYALGIGQPAGRSAKLGQFAILAGVAVAPDGRIVVADRPYDSGGVYDRIQVFNPDGTLDDAFRLSSKPSGVAVAPDGQIMVSVEQGYHPLYHPRVYIIHIFHPNGTFAHVFESAPLVPVQFDVPSFAVAPDGRIVAPSPSAGYIQVFYPYGTPASSIGVYGHGPGQLNGPADAAVAPDGRIVVADTGNDRIQVFHPHGTLDHAFGSHGTGPGQFVTPTDIAVAPDGRIVVADTGFAPNSTIYDRSERRIQVFHPNGTLALVIGPYGVVGDEFRDLHDLAAGPVPPAIVDPAPVVVVEPDGSGGLRNYTNIGDAVNLTIDVAGLTPAPTAAPPGGGTSPSLPSDGSDPSTVMFPPRETTVITSFAEVTFPPSVTASNVPADGMLALRISSVAPPPDDQVQGALAYGGSGRVELQRIIEIGADPSGSDSGTPRVTFDQPVRILLEGQAGGRAFYIQGVGGEITPIDAACAADDTARVHRQLAGAGECQIDSDDGADKIIYTHHLTLFGTVRSESGSPPPVVHTCSARLGLPALGVSVTPGGYSQSARQALINSGSLPFTGVELNATPWYVDWVGNAPPPPDAGHPSLPASISRVLVAGATDAVAVNGTSVARGLKGGDATTLGFAADLTPYDEVQGGVLVQYVTYLALCNP